MSIDGSSGPGRVGLRSTRVDISERPALAVSGWLGVIVLFACGWAVKVLVAGHHGWLWVPIVVAVLVATLLVVVAPVQTSVIQFFGSYVGTVRRPGFWCVLPLTVRRGVSLRVRNFETNHLKVNDADGNPVDIAAIVVWQVVDTARSTYAVDSYRDFVTVQSESALRHVATSHPYDEADGESVSLRGATDLVSDELAREVAERVTVAGVEVVEVRVSHLAYAQDTHRERGLPVLVRYW